MSVIAVFAFVIQLSGFVIRLFNRNISVLTKLLLSYDFSFVFPEISPAEFKVLVDIQARKSTLKAEIERIRFEIECVTNDMAKLESANVTRGTTFAIKTFSVTQCRSCRVRANPFPTQRYGLHKTAPSFPKY